MSYMNSTTFDAIVIGSSPLLIIHACNLARQGLRVGIFERAGSWGGAWRTIDTKLGEKV